MTRRPMAPEGRPWTAPISSLCRASSGRPAGPTSPAPGVTARRGKRTQPAPAAAAASA